MIVVTVARKPIVGSVATNALKHGPGGLNIDGCRIATAETITTHAKLTAGGTVYNRFVGVKTHQTESQKRGRWPANLILMHRGECHRECVSGCPVEGLDEQSGFLLSRGNVGPTIGGGGMYGFPRVIGNVVGQYDSGGGASRFFNQVRGRQ